MQKDSFTIKYF